MFDFARSKRGQKYSWRFWFRTICWIIILTFSHNTIGINVLQARSAYAQSALMPAPGTLLSASPTFMPPMLLAISIDENDPFNINFILESEKKANVGQKEIKPLIQYFLTFLTIPEKDLWVNLSPHEKDRVVDPDLEATLVGRDMLMEDYLLKQLSASMSFPGKEPGKTFWKKVNAKIHARYGDINIPADMFSKVWVVPEKGVVYEQNNSAYIAESRLKVLLEEDYLSLKHEKADTRDSHKAEEMNQLYATIAREVIIPELEREVNEGKHFVHLRQMYHSLILAIWFKRQLKKHIVNIVYTDQKKLSGIEINEKKIGEKIYKQYLKAVKKGAYDIIRKEYDPRSREVVSRQYFSGGFSFGGSQRWFKVLPESSFKIGLNKLIRSFGKKFFKFTVSLIPKGVSRQILLSTAAVAFMASANVNAQAIAPSKVQDLSPPQRIELTQEEAPRPTWPASQKAGQEDIKISQTIINREDPIPPTDKKYFTFLKTFLEPDEVSQMNQKTNPFTGRRYRIDDAYMKRNWEKLFSTSLYNWPQEALIITAQDKLGVQVDGDLGPETRSALEAQLAPREEIKPDPALKKRSLTLKRSGPKPETDQDPLTGTLTDLSQKVRAMDADTLERADNPNGQTPASARSQDSRSLAENPKNTQSEIRRPAKNITQGTYRQEIPAIQQQTDKGSSANPKKIKKPAETRSLSQEQKDHTLEPVSTPQRIEKKDQFPYAPYHIKTETIAVPVENTLKAPAKGIVTHFDPRKREYAQNDLIFTLVNPRLEREQENLEGQLAIAEKRLLQLKKLHPHQAATSYEVKAAAKALLLIQKQLDHLKQQAAAHRVYAPYDMTIKNTTVSNGMMVSKGMALLDYFNHDRVRVHLKVPPIVNSFNQLRHFQINGQKVQNITHIDWQLTAHQDAVNLSLTMIPPDGLQTSQSIQITMEIIPPEPIYPALSSVEGKTTTIASVHRIETQNIVAPADGKVTFGVHEGQRVKAGQWLGRINHQAYFDEYRNTIKAYNQVQDQLNILLKNQKQGRHFSRTQLESLQKEKSSLWAQLISLKTRIGQLEIFAPQSGMISRLSAPGSVSFSEGEALMRIQTGRVFVGDMYNMQKALLLSRDLDLTIDDPVLVETPAGLRLPARIISIDKTPQSQTVNLHDLSLKLQAVQVMVEDPGHLLGEALPVKVIIPKDAEKTPITALLQKADEHHARQEHAARKRTRSNQLALRFQQTNPPERVLEEKPVSTERSSLAQPQGKMLTITQVADLIAKNNLLNTDVSTAYLQKKIAEELPNSTRLSLKAGVIMDNEGKLSLGGGLNGVIQGIAGGIESGNAIGAALPIVFQLSGEIIDVLSGKKVKEQELAQKMTTIAKYHMEETITQRIHAATQRLIDIGKAQQHARHLENLLQDLEKAQAIINERYKQGFASIDQVNALRQTIEETRLTLLDWQRLAQKHTVQLNHELGWINEHVEDAIAPQLAWDGEFTTPSSGTENQWFQTLLSTETDNYSLKKAYASLEAVQQTIRLQKLDKLPSINLNSLYITDGDEFNPMYDLVSGSVLKSGAMAEGYNGALHFNFDVIDTAKDAKTAIVALEKEKAVLHVKQTKATISRDLTATLNQLKDLSRQIVVARKAYQRAHSAWQQKLKRPDLYNASQLINDRQQAASSLARLTDLKAQFFKAESHLRRLQVLPQDGSLVEAATATDSRTASGTHSATTPESLKIKTPQNSVPLGQFLQVPHRYPGFNASPSLADKDNPLNLISVGNINYTATSSVAQNNEIKTWSLMHKGAPQAKASQIQAVYNILTKDPNLLKRSQSFQYLMEELQNNPQFLKTIEDIILHTPYPDVAQKLLLAMADRDDADILFFLHLINRSLEQNNPFIAQLGFQALQDVFINHPLIFDQLSEIHVSHFTQAQQPRDHLQMPNETVERTLLHFLNWDGDGSLAQTRLLRSKFWTLDQLAHLHVKLLAEQKQTTDPRVSKQTGQLAHLLLDEIMRRNALDNISEIFHLGPYKTIGPINFEQTLYSRFMLQELAQNHRAFLTQSPDWRNMEDHITAELMKKARQATEDLIKSQPAQDNKPAMFTLGHAHRLQEDVSDTLDYFDQQALQAQKRHIQMTLNLPELARILTINTPLKGLALDCLMQTPTGRMLTLETYLRSEDPLLLNLIESRSWYNHIQKDIQKGQTSPFNHIYRQALEKMYQRTRHQWPLNLRLATYTVPELHAANDLRNGTKVEDQIKLKATQLALRFIKDKNTLQPRFYAGQSVYSPQELSLLNELQHRIDFANDPEDLDDYLKQRMTSDNHRTAREKSLIKDITKWRDKFSHNIQNLDEIQISKLPISSKLILGSIFAFFFGIFASRMRGSLAIRWGKTDDLIQTLRRELSMDTENGNGKPRAKRKKRRSFRLPWIQSAVHRDKTAEYVVAIPEKGLHAPSVPLLQNWHKQVVAMAQNHNKPRSILENVNSVLNNAYAIIQRTPYNPKVMWNEDDSDPILNDKYQRTFNYFNLLAIDTLNVLNQIVHNNVTFDTNQKIQLQKNIHVLIEMIEYATTYSRILEYRGIIDKVMTYKFSRSHWTERLQVYPLLRWMLLYDYQLKTSVKHIHKELPELMNRGNQLVPHMYNNPPMIMQNSKHLLGEVVAGAHNLTSYGSHNMRTKNKMRSFYSRLRMVFFPLASLGISLMGIIGVSGVNIGLSLGGLAGIAISFLIFWMPHINIMQMPWSKIVRHLTTKLKTSLYARLNGVTKAKTHTLQTEKETDEEIVTLAAERNLALLDKELHQDQQPNVDMIIIVPEDSAYRNSLKKYVKKRRGKIFRQDVPVEVLAKDSQGSGNAYLEALQFARRKLQDTNFRNRYPHLQSASWKDLNIMFVLHGKNDIQDELVLDWTITNGYSAMSCIAGVCTTDPEDPQSQAEPKREDKNGKHIVLFSRDVYFGPMQEFSDDNITLFTSWVNKDDLKNLGLINMDMSQEKIQVREILEKLNIDKLEKINQYKIHRNKIFRYLQENFHLDNPHLRQFPALIGTMIFDSNTIELFGNVLDKLEENPDLWQDLHYIHMTSDILNILIKDKEEIMDNYVDRRIKWADINKFYAPNQKETVHKSLYKFYRLFYENNESLTGHLTTNAFLPFPQTAKLFHVSSERDVETIKNLLKDRLGLPPVSGEPERPPEDNAMAVDKETGGLDFSKTGDVLDFQNKDIPVPRQNLQPALTPNLPAQPLQFFKGFHFQIMSFQPLHNPIDFLSANHL